MDSIEKNLYSLLWLTRPLHQEIETAVSHSLPEGVTVRMRAVLEALRESGAATVPAIARDLSIKRQYVQLMMNDLITGGYAQALDNPAHKRSSLFDLTDQGAALIFKIRSAEQKTLHEMATDLDAQDVATALKVSTQLLQRFQHLSTR